MNSKPKLLSLIFSFVLSSDSEVIVVTLHFKVVTLVSPKTTWLFPVAVVPAPITVVFECA